MAFYGILDGLPQNSRHLGTLEVPKFLGTSWTGAKVAEDDPEVKAVPVQPVACSSITSQYYQI